MESWELHPPPSILLVAILEYRVGQQNVCFYVLGLSRRPPSAATAIARNYYACFYTHLMAKLDVIIKAGRAARWQAHKFVRGNIQTSPDLEFYGRVDLRFPLQWETFYMSFVRCVEDILELSQISCWTPFKQSFFKSPSDTVLLFLKHWSAKQRKKRKRWHYPCNLHNMR